MSRLTRWLRRQLERLLGVWHEGPEPPRRLGEDVRLFRHMHPNATAREWERFAIRHAGNAYRDAFVRGFEWNERCWPEPHIDADAVAIVHGHDVSLGDNDPDLRHLLESEPLVLDPMAERLIDELARSQYPFQIQIKEHDE